MVDGLANYYRGVDFDNPAYGFKEEDKPPTKVTWTHSPSCVPTAYTLVGNK